MPQVEKASKPGWITFRNVCSATTLLIACLALALALMKPVPVSAPQTRNTMVANAQSFQTKVDQLAQAQADGQSGTEVHLGAGEISAAIAQASGALPTVEQGSADPKSTATPADLSALVGGGEANVGEPLVSFEGDVMKGQFVTELAGKKVYVTVNGHLGSKDGYATFEPTEFKVGDLNVPVSLVNDALQKKMLEQRDRLKLPDYISDVRVENGELVIKQK